MPHKQKKNDEEKVFAEWANATTAHGFVDFYEAKTWLGRTIWFILIFASLTLMSYQLFRLTNDFSQHEWITRVKEKNPNSNDGIDFPSIIICNVNRLKWSKAMEYDMTLDMINFFFLQTQLVKTLAPDGNVYSHQDQFIKWQKEHYFSYLEIFDKIGPSFDDIFIDTIRTGSDEQNFTADVVFTYEYGRCHRIKRLEKVAFVGSQSGTTMLLDVQGWDYVPLLYNNYVNQGFVMQVTYKGSPELGQWIKLLPGTQTSISLQPVESTVMLQDRSVINPFSFLDSSPPCALDPKLRFSTGQHYSTIECKMECYIAVAVQECNCIPFFPSEDYRTCEPEKMLNCISGYNFDQYGHYNESAEAQIQNDLRECINTDCDAPCYERSLETQVTMMQFPSDNQRNQMEDYLVSKNLSHVRSQDIIYLEIYFSKLRTKVTEMYESMSLEDLISNSGGLIGLWAGMSFLTVFQAIAYLIRFFEVVKERRAKKVFTIRELMHTDQPT